MQVAEHAKVRKNLVLTLVLSTIVANLLIILPDDHIRVIFTNWTINAVAAAALGMSLVIFYRQKLDGLYGKTYAALTFGLVLWFAAEMIWTYYELGEEIENPFPSIADAFWIAGYAPFAYHLFRTWQFFGRSSKRNMIIAGAAVFAFAAYTVYLICSTMEASGDKDMLTLVVSVAYPVLDAVLIVPAVAVLSNLRQGKLTFTLWALLSLSLLVVAAADSGFAYYTAAGMEDEIWVLDVLYNTSYIVMTATLFWHYRFFVFDENKVKREWQQENR